MLNRWPILVLWLAWLATTSADLADEVSCLQSAKPEAKTEAFARPTELVETWASVRGHWLQSLLRWWHAKPAVMLGQMASRIDSTDTSLMFLVFGAVLLFFFGLLACFANMALRDLMKEDLKEVEEAAAKAARTHAEVPFVQPAETLKNEALPAICGQFVSSSHQPFVVPLRPIQDGKEWTLQVYSQNSKRAILLARLFRAGHERKRSYLEVRNHESEQLLGTITSSLEILVPDGRRYGRLVARRGSEYLLQEDSGREPRWSMAEDEGTLTAVWLPRRGTGQRMYQDLKDGFHRLGKLPVNHRQRGTLLSTVARPDGSNGHRLELMSVSGVDAVLVLLCALGLLTFDGMFDVIPRTDFQAETVGPAKADPSPAVQSSFSPGTGTSSMGAQFATDCYSSMAAPQFVTDCYSSLSAPQFTTDCNCLGSAVGGPKEDHPQTDQRSQT